MIAEVKAPEKMMPIKQVRVLRQSNGWRVLLEEGMNSKGHHYKARLDFYKGELRQKLSWEEGSLTKTIFFQGRKMIPFYEKRMTKLPEGLTVIEDGWTGKRAYFSLTRPDGRKFAHFGDYVVEEWNNEKGRVREVSIDKDGKNYILKRTLQQKGKPCEVVAEHKARAVARGCIRLLKERSDLTSHEKWLALREIVARYHSNIR